MYTSDVDVCVHVVRAEHDMNTDTILVLEKYLSCQVFLISLGKANMLFSAT